MDSNNYTYVIPPINLYNADLMFAYTLWLWSQID